MTNHEFMDAAVAKAEECWSALIYKHANHPKIDKILDAWPSIPVYFDLKGTRAGTAHYRDGAMFIRINLAYVRKDGEALLNRTVPHEIAHLFDFALTVMGCGKGRSHGPRWSSFMMMLDADSSRCHKYDMQAAQVTRRGPHPRNWHYICDCGQDFWLTTRMHNSIRKGRGRICPRCRGSVRQKY